MKIERIRIAFLFHIHVLILNPFRFKPVLLYSYCIQWSGPAFTIPVGPAL
jgi:hypothetical protein